MVEFIAAPPGYTRLRYYCSESGEPRVDRQPVLMWRIDRLVGSPVMVPGELPSHDCLGEGVLLRRGGRVAVLGDKINSNEKTWTRAMREAHATGRRRRFKTGEGLKVAHAYTVPTALRRLWPDGSARPPIRSSLRLQRSAWPQRRSKS